MSDCHTFWFSSGWRAQRNGYCYCHPVPILRYIFSYLFSYFEGVSSTRGGKQRGLELLDKLDRAFEKR